MTVTVSQIMVEADEGVLNAVKILKEVITSNHSKTSEKITSANSLIKIKTSMMNLQRQQIYDRLDLKLKRNALRASDIKLMALEKLNNPKATPEEIAEGTRTLTPDMKPDWINDSVAREKL